jgi:predicted ATPase
MQRGELLAIENPEVHLHPSLQLKVTEFLLHQARAGKMMFIETHSDLVVRRAIRAILQEEISQEEVRIYFCDIDESHEGYRYSRLRPMQVSELGRIDNWPKGFMASDISESRRLFEVMYGALPEDGEDATG